MTIDECKDELNQQLVELRGELRQNRRLLGELTRLYPSTIMGKWDIKETQANIDEGVKAFNKMKDLLKDIAELERMANPAVYTNTSAHHEFECKHLSVLTSLEEFGLFATNDEVEAGDTCCN